MQLRYIKNMQPAQQQIARVTASCWSPNNKRLAIADHNRFVHLFDENGDRRDKFSTKAADQKGAKTYVIRGMCFAPDSTRLAIAQSDNIVFVYKLGLDWHDKKSICNKFQQASSVTCVVWPTGHNNELVFGIAEGKVRIGNLKTNRAQTLYTTDSYVVALASCPDGSGIISGHLDGSIYRFYFEEHSGGGAPQAKLNHHPVIPYALAWGEAIAAAGSDCKVVFYDRLGSLLQHFSYPLTEEKEFTCASFNPAGHSLVVGSWNRFRNFNYNSRQQKWEEGENKFCPNLYSVTTLAWKSDGSRLVVSSLCGSVDLFDACIRRYCYKGKFEFTYISPSQVIVKRLATGMRIVLKSQYGMEILKVNVYQEQYLVAHTDSTLLMGDLASCRLSEVPWNGAGRERFFFDNAQVCMVYHAGELALVEYGRNEILGSCRTEHINSHLLSVRLSEGTGEETPEDDRRKKTIAYLIDKHTVRILDLVSGIPAATVHHNIKVDWMELNKRATKLLFRDKHRCLYLYDIVTHERTTLLNYCSYVQWVPDSDVVVAQNRSDLCVWYSIDAPDRVAIVPIKGEVEEIERSPGRTEVIVDEGTNTVAYALDEGLIEFGAAMESQDYERACGLLEQITMTPETEALWQNLSVLALQEGRYVIAERCFAALGDVAKAMALTNVNRMAEELKEEHMKQYGTDMYDGYNHFQVRSQIHVLNKEFKKAEMVLLEQGKLDDAMQMWTDMHKFDESIAVAEAKAHPEVEDLKKKYSEWLLETNQEEKAGELKEREKKYVEAINLYLQGGLPAKAAHVVNSYHVTTHPPLLEAIASALLKAGMFEKAGDFFEKLEMHEPAIEAYKRGHSYRRAVELSRRVFPTYVIGLEEAWGDWLVAQKQVDAAINHYIESNQYIKAIEASINSRQWAKAVQIVDSQDPQDPITKKFYKLIASHFEDQRQYPEAEKYYIRAGLRQEAVEMYTRNNLWEMAHKVAKQYMSEAEISALYINQAQQYEMTGKYKDAERLYLKVNEPDLAIHMYKKVRQYDNMIRLVSVYRKELLFKTHQTLAVQLEREGNYKQAEYHYVQAKEWKAASNMYREAGMWEDAIRCAKLHGGVNASKTVVFAWAVHLGGEMGAKLLTKFGLVEQAIEYAIESGHFEHAIELAQTSLKSKLPYVHLKHAMYLEDEGRFKEAEDSFVKANKPKEAIDMYIHQHDWINAMRVADTFDPASITDILVAQARVAFERKDYEHAETFLLRASKPELLVKIYKEARMWIDAQRIAREYCPARLPDVNNEYANWLQHHDDNGNPADVARLWVESGDYNRAIDTYLKVSKNPAGNPEECVEAWKSAVQLSFNHVKDRLDEVLSTVAQRLMEISKHAEAAQMYENLEKYEEAVNVYIAGNDFEKAQAIGDRLSPEIAERVRQEQKKALMQMGSGHELYKQGNKLEALEIFRKQNDWESLMPKARTEGPTVALKYSALYVQYLMNNDKYEDAAKVIIQDGMSEDPQTLPTYMGFVKGFTGVLPVQFDIMPVRDHLFKLCEQMKPLGDVVPLDELRRLFTIMHHYSLAVVCKKNGLNDLAAKLVISLVRFCDIIPADKAFFDGGMAAKDMNWKNVAFMLLNRFLDITELVEDPDSDSSMLELGEFENTDIPVEFPIPRQPTVPAGRQEEARQWALTASLDKTIEHKLTTDTCPKCNASNWDAFNQCKQCQQRFESCVVTGYPVISTANRVQCRACKSPANQNDWNKYIMKMKSCPWCGNPQSAFF